MARRKRVKRPAGELKSELRDQIELMLASCTLYDGGLRAAANHLSLNLRVLLHQAGRSNSLLQQLGIRNIRFLDTAGPVNPNNLVSTNNLIVTRVGSDGAEHLAAIEAGGTPHSDRMIPFPEWWAQIVIIDSRQAKFSRRELVQHVANTDGGAHVDPELDEAYLALSRNNSLGWQFSDGTRTIPLNDPVLPSIRQISHEVLETLKGKVPELFPNATEI